MYRRIFAILILMSLAIGGYMYLNPAAHGQMFLLVGSSLSFLMLSFGIHGLIAHSLHPKFKGQIIFYPIWMWALWAVLFLMFVFLVLPLICENFSPVL